MDVSLSPELEAPIDEQDQALAKHLTAFDQELGRRLESLDQGRHISASEARTRLVRKSEEQRRQAQA